MALNARLRTRPATKGLSTDKPKASEPFSTNVAKKTRVDGIMGDFLAASEKKLTGIRRPPIKVSNEVLQGLVRALEREPVLVISLDRFVELIGVSKAYADPQGVHLLVSSLNRRWKDK